MTASPPLVSVVLPVYNGEAHLARAVGSILRQSFRDFELLVIDDGSTDASGAILAGVSDPRLRVLRQENLGLVAALNRGIAEARGEFLARMDHDDISLPRRLEWQIEWLRQHPGHAAVGCQFAQMDEGGRVLNRVVPLPTTHQGILERIGKGWLGILHPTMFMRRDALRQIGGYDARVRPYCEDVDLVYRLACRWQLGNISRVAYLYRLTRQAVSTAGFSRQRRSERVLLAAWRRFLRHGEYRLTEEDYLWLDNKWPQPSDPARSAAHYHNRMGRALLRGGRFWEAGWHYLLAARNRPLQLLAYSGLLRAFLHLGRVKSEFEPDDEQSGNY